MTYTLEYLSDGARVPATSPDLKPEFDGPYLAAWKHARSVLDQHPSLTAVRLICKASCAEHDLVTRESEPKENDVPPC